MILSTDTHARSLFLLPQHCSESSAYEPVHPLKRHWMSMLKVVKPAAKRRVQFNNDLCQTIPARAFSPHPNAIAECLEALFANPAPPRLEPIAQKFKALSRLSTVTHVRFVDIETQPVLFYPHPHFLERNVRLFGTLAEHDKIIGIANHAVALLLHPTIQSMEINVSQQRTDHRPLRRSTHRRPSLHFFNDVLPQKRF